MKWLLWVASPTPNPSPSMAVDPQRVTPGILGLLSLLFLIVAVVILYFSMRKQLRKVKFDEDALPAGVKRLPAFSTREARQKAADDFERSRQQPPESGTTTGDTPAK